VPAFLPVYSYTVPPHRAALERYPGAAGSKLWPRPWPASRCWPGNRATRRADSGGGTLSRRCAARYCIDDRL